MSSVALLVDSAAVVLPVEDVAAQRIGAVEIGAVCADPGVRRLARQIQAGDVAWNDLRQPRWYELTLMLTAWLPVKTAEQFDACRPVWMPPWAATTWYVECADFGHLVAESRRHPYVRKRLYPVERYALVAPYVSRTLALRLAERANECACGSREAYTVALYGQEGSAQAAQEAEWLCAACAQEVDRRVRVLALADQWDRVFGKYGSRMMESQLENAGARSGEKGQTRAGNLPAARGWQWEYRARTAGRVAAEQAAR
jgi:hypothetical protein